MGRELGSPEQRRSVRATLTSLFFNAFLKYGLTFLRKKVRGSLVRGRELETITVSMVYCKAVSLGIKAERGLKHYY